MVRLYRHAIGTDYDSTYIPKSERKFESIELKWYDNKCNDEITLIKVKMNENKGFGSWTLNLRNESLFDQLSKTHDPFYNLPIPKEK